MGRDKAVLVIDGVPLADRTAALLRQVAAPVIEVGPGFTTLPSTREEPPGSGPLVAIVSGAAALRRLEYHGPVLVVATDLPRLTAAYLHVLANHRAPSADHSVVPRDGGGRAQPLCARYSPAALTRAQELVGAGHRSMSALLAAIDVIWLDPSSGAGSGTGTDDVLRDIDTPEEFAQWHQPQRP
jgi:molybdopterin-guanine dinucleotide biosynthesis protein A